MAGRLPREPLVERLATLRRGTPRTPGPFEDLLNAMLGSEAASGLIARSAAVLLQKPVKERGSVISALHRHTEFLDSPHLHHTLGRSTFDLADLKRKRMSLFLCLPSDRLPEYHRWVRLMVGGTLRVLMRTRGRPAHRVLLLLDEFQNLGRLGPVERDMSLAGGFGVQFWLFSDHPRAYGSRYFGPVRKANVIAVLQPVWTWR